MFNVILFIVCIAVPLLFPQPAPAELVNNKDSGNNVFTDFRQVAPEIGNKSTEDTGVEVRYDSDNLYVTFSLSYKNPGQIFASVLERDQPLDNDDYVEVIIDSYNDKNNALGFQTNFLGTRRDFELTGNGVSINTSWNAFWYVSTERTVQGWNAEFVIPFSTLRYETSKINVMGFKFIRFIKSNNETDIFPLKNPELDGALFHLYNSREIGFRNLERKTPLYVTPYISGNISSGSVLNTAGSGYVSENQFFEGKDYFSQPAVDKILSNVGVDLKYRLNNSTTLDLTLNTDFAQAEADDRILNFSRFSVSLPEKRSFFLENIDFFAASTFQHELFHSRNVGISGGETVPIIGGVRLTGTSSNFQYGAMNIQTGGLKAENINAENFSVLRLKKYFSENNSYLGGIFTNKESTGSSFYNRAAGVDGRYYFNEDLYTTVFASKSFSRISDNGKSNAFGLAISQFRRNGYVFEYRYRDYQEGFDPQTGYVARPDTKRFTLNNGYASSFTDNEIFSTLDFGAYYNSYWISSTGQPEYGGGNLYWHSVFRDGASLAAYAPVFEKDHLYADWNFSDNITIPIGKYNFTTYEVYYNSGNRSSISYELDPIFGGFYGGFQYIFLSSLNVVFNRNFNIDLEFDYYNFNFPASYAQNNDPQEIITLYAARLNYAFSSSVSLKSFFQFDSGSNSLGTNIRLRFNPSEGTDLYIVYNQNINTVRERYSPQKPLIESQTLILKFSKILLF